MININLKQYYTKKRAISAVVLCVLAGIAYMIFGPKDLSKNILTDKVKKLDLKQTVLSTGQVTSETELDLSFQTSGVVSKIYFKEGDKVKPGQVIAQLDQGNQLASLTSARGSYAAAEAAYQKLLSGATNSDVAVSVAAVDSARATLENAERVYDIYVEQQKTLVANAYTTMLNAGLSPIRLVYFDTTATLTVSGTYTATEQGSYNISLTSSGNGNYDVQVTGLEKAIFPMIRGTPLPLGTKGLFVTFSTTGTFSAIDSWKIDIPNTQSSSYVTYSNAYQAALKTQTETLTSARNSINSARSAYDASLASLAYKKSNARPEDLAAAQAQILSAQGQVQAALANLENTIIRSPSAGTITGIEVKIGELATAQQTAILLKDVDNLHIEAQVSEANIASVALGQKIDMTFDSLGPDRHFEGTVQTINPASTVISGVVDYKVTASINIPSDIKPGMTANMVILTNQKPAALAVQLRSVLNHDGKKFLRVIDDPKKKTFHEVEVICGIEADGGLVEILSGISEGTEIVTFIKQ